MKSAFSSTYSISQISSHLQNNAGQSQPARIESIDVVRGLAMILMALDHVRDYFSNVPFSPLDLTYTNVPLFLTRWITHLVAPTFVLFTGVSAFLWASFRHKSTGELARFLLTRGLWLIILELTVVRFAWFFSLDYEFSIAQVIWAIGWSMIALAGLVYLPRWLNLSVAAAMILGHNLLDRFYPDQFGSFSWLWSILHVPNTLEVIPGHRLIVLYPLVPWIGVMALGYGLGPLFLGEKQARLRWFVRLGLGMILAFIFLRAIKIYGDPTRWFPQRNATFTVLSFLNVEKYPPSLLFLLITLGPVFIALAVLERPLNRVTRVIMTYGRVPLFYYVLHLLLIHALAVSLAYLKYGSADWLLGSAWLFRADYPPDYGYDLPVVYLIWLGVVAALFPACRWFARVKQQRGDWWLSYL